MSTYNWYRCFFKDELNEESVLSAPARGVFGGLKKLMLCVNGPIKNDPAWIARRLSFRDKRTVVKALEEMIDIGVIVVTDAGLVHEGIMQEIKNHGAARAESGMKGGRGNKATLVQEEEQFDNSFVSDAELMPNCSETVGVQPIEKQQNTEKLLREEKNRKEEAPSPPQAVPVSSMNGHANGSDEMRDHAQDIVQAFDRLIVEFWGKQAARFAAADNDIDTAAKWLAHMEGDASGVIQAIDDCMADEANRGRMAPPRLSFYNGSIPRFMAAASRPVTLTANSPSSAGKARQGGGEALWMIVAEKAAMNWHDDILTKLQHLGKEDPDRANDYAAAVKELVSRPKAQAAA